MESKETIVIAGASGFIGKSLIPVLKEKYNVVGLSRKKIKNSDIKWINCDLYNLRESEEALKNCDCLIYLVHSMNKTSRLTQAKFEDLDLIIADNVRRAAIKWNVKQIIYLGGIIPTEKKLSRHLKSRKEVEAVLSSSNIPVTIIRAAIIIGAESSSFKIVFNLVKKLKVMICPIWTQTLSKPVDVDDVICAISKCVLNKETYSMTFDAFGANEVTYNELMILTAKSLAVKRKIITVPFFSLNLSKLWVYFISNEPYETVSPLIDSLKYKMTPMNTNIFRSFVPNPIPLDKSIQKAIVQYNLNKNEVKKNQRTNNKEILNNVCSIQRLILPKGWNAINVAEHYIKWLPQYLYTLIKVDVDGEFINFKFLKLILLTLYHSTDRSSTDRQLFYIRGGLLVKKPIFKNARLEFRVSPHEQSIISAIHDFYPSLPWYIYLCTQAIIHSYIMNKFNDYLINKNL